MNMGSYSCCQKSSNSSKLLKDLVPFLKIVGEESRLKILCVLRDGTHCVCELEDHIEASQSLLSHHLKDLKDAGLVASHKEGLNVYYALTKKGKGVSDSLFKLLER